MFDIGDTLIYSCAGNKFYCYFGLPKHTEGGFLNRYVFMFDAKNNFKPPAQVMSSRFISHAKILLVEQNKLNRRM